MNRIEKKFSELKKRRKKALIVFMTAGDPGLEKNGRLIEAFEKDGVDLIELGVPFSDPLADGPVIQASSQRSLKRKTDLKKILALVKNARRKTQIPLVLMSYLNPILRYGIKRFAADAGRSGVDGLIVPDLPPEEGRLISRVLRDGGLCLVYLLAPTSASGRVKKVARASRGFIYYVSLTGVTGVRRFLPRTISGDVSRIKRQSRLPVCVGFGVSTPRQARQVSARADGVIIGSAIVRLLDSHPGLGARQFSRKFIRPFAKALERRI